MCLIDESVCVCSFRPSERSGEDVDIILTRLKDVKAFERFHPNLLQQICLCGFYECLERGITCRSCCLIIRILRPAFRAQTFG